MDIKFRDNLPQSNVNLHQDDIENARLNNRFVLTGAVPQGWPALTSDAAQAAKYIVFLEYISVGAGNTFDLKTWDNASTIASNIEGQLDLSHSPLRCDGGFRVTTSAILIAKGFYLVKN